MYISNLKSDDMCLTMSNPLHDNPLTIFKFV